MVGVPLAGTLPCAYPSLRVPFLLPVPSLAGTLDACRLSPITSSCRYPGRLPPVIHHFLSDLSNMLYYLYEHPHALLCLVP
jgi:hypothetical protein